MQEFTYNISETVNSRLNIQKINSQLYKVGLDSKVMSIQVLDTSFILFMDDSVAKADIDLIVANHDGNPVALAKILRYVPEEEQGAAIHTINFKKGLNTRLHNKKTWVFGRLLKEEFYPFGGDLTTVDTSDLILQISYDYSFNEVTREANYRLEKIIWFDEENSIVSEKLQPKIYTGHEGMGEAKTRRANIIDALKHDLDSFSKSGETDNSALVNQLIQDIKEYIALYVDYGSFAIIQVISGLSNPLLDGLLAPDLTVRQYMTSKLDFLTVEAGIPDLYKGSLL